MTRLPHQVLFVLPHCGGSGAERAVLTLLRHLDRRAFAPALFILSDDSGASSETPRDIPVSHGSMKHEQVGSVLWQRLRSGAALLRAAQRSRVIVGGVEWSSTTAALAMGTVLRKPVLGWVHAQLDHFVTDDAGRQRLGRQYRRLDRVVCVSTPTAESVVRLAPSSRRRVEVIPNATDLELIRASAERPLPGWSAPVFLRPTMLAAGRLDWSKGFDVLIRAHADVRRRGIEHHLLIVGEGADRPELERLARELGVAETVFMPGFVPNPLPLFAAATAFALSSRSEGLPTVVLEALTLGVPVVASACGGADEILRGRDCGLLVPVGHQEALAAAIATVLSEPELRARLALNGQARSRDYAVAAILPRWEAALADLARGRSG